MDTKESNNEVEKPIAAPQDSTPNNEATETTNEQAEEIKAEDAEIEEPKAIKEEVTEIEVAETEEPITEATDSKEETTKEEPMAETTDSVEETEKVEPIAEVINSDEETEKDEPVAETTEAEEVKNEKTEAVETDKPVEEATESEEETVNEEPIVETEASEEATESDESDDSVTDTETEAIEEVDYATLSMEELVAALEELVQTDNIVSIKTAVTNIKSNFIKNIKQIKQDHFDKHIGNGGTEDDYKSIRFDYEDKYQAAFTIYKEKRKKYIAELEELKAKNLIKKKELLENLRNMINSEESLNKIYKEFQQLQDDWREIGIVPQGEVNELWNNYHFLVEKFFDKVKLNKELMMIGLNRNLEEKIALCEKTEELLLEKSINKSFLKLQEYHTKWKEVGPVPNEKNEEIWERFKNASDKINVRRQEHYEEMHEEQKNNLVLKTALCERIEVLTEHLPDGIKAWNKMTDDVNALFTEWKTLGPTPKKTNDEIWKRFKDTMNNFFNDKKSFYSRIKDEQMNNYQLKLDLVAQANSIKDSQEWKDTTNTLINLQKKWKTIGMVPRKYSDKVWKDFRAACDHFFDAKDDFFKNINKVEKDNKALKLEIIERFEKQEFTDDNKKSLDLIKDYQREWIKVGRVPFKDKNSLQAKFQKVVDQHLDSLNIDSFELENEAFKTRLDGAENTKDAEYMIRKEIGYLKGKIETIEKDVNLWENNISFFSNSKNADLLKADFEKKIDKAKKDIKTFKAKIRHFDKMKRDL